MMKYLFKYQTSNIPRARKLRRDMTNAERKPWSLLRRDRCGVYFRRQVPFGPYILDFCSIKIKLVVELDGGQHFVEKGIVADRKRDAALRKQGLAVLRFTDREVLTNTDGVMHAIYEQIQKRLRAS